MSFSESLSKSGKRRSGEDRRASEDRRRSARGLFQLRARRESADSDRRQSERRDEERRWWLFWRRAER